MAGFLAFLEPARDQFFKAHEPLLAFSVLEPHLNQPDLLPFERRATFELGGMILKAQKRYEEAFQLYKEINDLYQMGYCFLLMGRLHEVGPYWAKLLTEHPNHWCNTLYGMATHQLATYPTLLQIRNHLESDVTNLVAAGQFTLLESILTYADFLAQLNLEAYKFIGRALMNADRLSQAETYLMQGQKLLPNDPEIYYHLGQYSFAQQQYSEAVLMLNQCLLISPTYSPAKVLLDEIAALPE